MKTNVSAQFYVDGIEVDLDLKTMEINLEKYRKDLEQRVQQKIEEKAQEMFQAMANKIQLIALGNIDKRVESTVDVVIINVVQQLMQTDEMRAKLQQLADRKVSE